MAIETSPNAKLSKINLSTSHNMSGFSPVLASLLGFRQFSNFSQPIISSNEQDSIVHHHTLPIFKSLMSMLQSPLSASQSSYNFISSASDKDSKDNSLGYKNVGSKRSNTDVEEISSPRREKNVDVKNKTNANVKEVANKF